MRLTTGLKGLGALVAVSMVLGLPTVVSAEQASQPAAVVAGSLDVGRYHACAVLSSAGVRCWGYGAEGALGYGNAASIGDDETPAAAGPVNVGAGRTATALSAGSFHTCALLDDKSVRCWGYGANGRLGYGTTNSIGDDESPGAVGPVALGAKAKAIAAGEAHTCGILDDDTVRCWGFGFDGRLGYGNTSSIGDDEPPSSAGPVSLGAGRTAKAITAGNSHTCALLDDGNVRCWGANGIGQLGYGNKTVIGNDEPADAVGTVKLGAGRTAVAISAGNFHTCALLDDGSVRCWGNGANGRLGYGTTTIVGDDETPDAVGPVDLGAGRKAVAISAGAEDTCALLDDGTVRCWGKGADGRLGYGNTNDIGDDETPGVVGPVDLGVGRTATAISAGATSTCAHLNGGTVRCWGDGANGLLGLCYTSAVGDDEKPSAAGTVNLEPGDGGATCGGATPPPPPPPPPSPSPTATATPTPYPIPKPDPLKAALARQRIRAAALRACLRKAGMLPPTGAHPSAKRRRARSRIAKRRSACLKRHGRIPGRVTRLVANRTGPGKVRLSFRVAGTDGAKAPAARSYLVKQSERSIRNGRDFTRAHSLCTGRCSFAVTRLDATVKLNIVNLRRHRRYSYAVAARDNVSGRLGPRSATIRIRTG